MLLIDFSVENGDWELVGFNNWGRFVKAGD